MILTSKNFYKHISFTLCNDIADICKPLKEKFNIECFGFQHDFVDEDFGVLKSSACLFNNAEVFEFLALHYQDHELATYDIRRNHKYYFIENYSPKWTTALKERHKLQHFIGTCEKNSNNEFVRYGFAMSTEGNSKYPDFYLNNLDLLDGFIAYFKEKAAKHIALSCKYRWQVNRPAVFLDEESTTNREEFLDAIKLKKISFHDKYGRPVKIPLAEMRCLDLLARGRSAKETASILDLSPRTVECNWAKSKIRLNCYTRSEMLNLLEKQRKNQIRKI